MVKTLFVLEKSAALEDRKIKSIASSYALYKAALVAMARSRVWTPIWNRTINQRIRSGISF